MRELGFILRWVGANLVLLVGGCSTAVSSGADSNFDGSVDASGLDVMARDADNDVSIIDPFLDGATDGSADASVEEATWTVSVGNQSSCASRSFREQEMGRAFCWGSNENGKLGDVTGEDARRPREIAGLSGVRAVTSFADHSCALLYDGHLFCWGRNDLGQLGNGRSEEFSAPTLVPNLENIVQVSLGTSHSCALNASGRVYCWGLNQSGQLGTGESSPRSMVPVLLPNLMDVVQLSSGASHTCARRTNGSVFCWGSNQFGQMGNGGTASSFTPTEVPNLLGARSIASGNLHACAILADGSVSCWGAKYQNNDLTNLLEPTHVPGIDEAVALAAGGFNTCAIQSNGTVRCMGQTIATELTEMPALFGSQHLAIGSNHYCAVFEAGIVKCWGTNSRGQVGDGSITDRALPVAVAFD